MNYSTFILFFIKYKNKITLHIKIKLNTKIKLNCRI